MPQPGHFGPTTFFLVPVDFFRCGVFILVVMNINTITFAARDFSPRRGASDEHTPEWVCKERATKSGRKRAAARRGAPNLACGFVARRSQPRFGGCSLLAPCHRPNWAQRTS